MKRREEGRKEGRGRIDRKIASSNVIDVDAYYYISMGGEWLAHWVPASSTKEEEEWRTNESSAVLPVE